MPRPGGAEGRTPPPWPRRSNPGTDRGPVFRCALRSHSCPRRRATCPGPAPCCSAGRAAGRGDGHGPGRAPLPEGGRELPPEPGSGAAACRSGGTRSGRGTGHVGRVAGSCCRLGKGCRKTPNYPVARGRGGRSDGALRIPRPGDRGRAIRPRPQPRTGENMVLPALLLILGIETKSPFHRRASGLPPGHGVRAAAGCGRRCWRGAAGPRGPGTCLPELAVWLLSSCPGARARGCRWTLWGSESTSRKVGWV